MAWFSVFMVFSLSWWLLLFMVLPFGVETNPNPDSGHDVGAPKYPRLRIKLCITTLLAVIVTALFFNLFI